MREELSIVPDFTGLLQFDREQCTPPVLSLVKTRYPYWIPGSVFWGPVNMGFPVIDKKRKEMPTPEISTAENFKKLIRDAEPWFADIRLEKIREGYPGKYYNRIRTSENAVIEFEKVVGCVEAEFAGKTWREILFLEKTQEVLENLAIHPESFMGTEQKNIRLVSENNGQSWYIESGVPDFVVTKFLYHVTSHGQFLYGVSCRILDFNLNLEKKVQELLEAGYQVEQDSTDVVKVSPGKVWGSTTLSRNFLVNHQKMSESELLNMEIKPSLYSQLKERFGLIWGFR